MSTGDDRVVKRSSKSVNDAPVLPAYDPSTASSTATGGLLESIGIRMSNSSATIVERNLEALHSYQIATGVVRYVGPFGSWMSPCSSIIVLLSLLKRSMKGRPSSSASCVWTRSLRYAAASIRNCVGWAGTDAVVSVCFGLGRRIQKCGPFVIAA